jgi:hypothetical protein
MRGNPEKLLRTRDAFQRTEEKSLNRRGCRECPQSSQNRVRREELLTAKIAKNSREGHEE